MKKQELRMTRITLRDPKSTMSPMEYNIWKAEWEIFRLDAPWPFCRNEEFGVKIGSTSVR